MESFSRSLGESHIRLTKELRPEDPSYWRELASIYYELCRVHPFQDGNGRVSRLLLSLLLIQTMDDAVPLGWGLLPRRAHSTDRAFEAARERGDLWPLAKLLYRAYLVSARKLKKEPVKCNFTGRRRL